MAMYCKYSERDYGEEDVRTCLIISDAVPNSTDGADIDNLNDNATVGIGSVCINAATGKKYMVGLDEAWHEIA